MEKFWQEVQLSDTKRRRKPTAKPGELKAAWGNSRDDGRDLYFVGGGGVPRCDRALLCHVLTSQRWGFNGGIEPSFAEELHKRGYDLTTLRFSIQRKV